MQPISVSASDHLAQDHPIFAFLAIFCDYSFFSALSRNELSRVAKRLNLKIK
jgi:hypothetical protein